MGNGRRRHGRSVRMLPGTMKPYSSSEIPWFGALKPKNKFGDDLFGAADMPQQERATKLSVHSQELITPRSSKFATTLLANLQPSRAVDARRFLSSANPGNHVIKATVQPTSSSPPSQKWLRISLQQRQNQSRFTSAHLRVM